MSINGFNEADRTFMDSLTPEQRTRVYELIAHVLDAYKAGTKGLNTDQLAHPEDQCRHCQLPIAQRVDGSWVHVGPQGQTDVGCRAALFDIDEDAWFADRHNRNKAQPSRQGNPLK